MIVFDPAEIGAWIKEVGVPTVILMAVLWGIYRFAIWAGKRVDRFLDAHVNFVNRTADSLSELTNTQREIASGMKEFACSYRANGQG